MEEGFLIEIQTYLNPLMCSHDGPGLEDSSLLITGDFCQGEDNHFIASESQKLMASTSFKN